LKTFKLSHVAAVVSADPDIRAAAWQGAVREYSQRALTCGTDRLPGISGIVKEIALPKLGRYLAGLWEYQLSQTLLWRTTGGVTDRSDVHLRPPQYQGPTWSWASVVSAVILKAKKPSAPICRIIDVTCTTTTTDLYGHVQDGRMRISGPTKAVTLQRTNRVSQSTRYDVLVNTADPKARNELKGATMTSDIELTESTLDAIILLVEFECAPISNTRWSEGLVLVQSTRQTGCWERVGHFSGGLKLDHTTETELILV
jgi:hypothetical protein